MDWNPGVLDHDINNNEAWYDAIRDLQDGTMETPFDEVGNYRKREVVWHVFDKTKGATIEDVIDNNQGRHRQCSLCGRDQTFQEESQLRRSQSFLPLHDGGCHQVHVCCKDVSWYVTQEDVSFSISGMQCPSTT